MIRVIGGDGDGAGGRDYDVLSMMPARNSVVFCSRYDSERHRLEIISDFSLNVSIRFHLGLK